MVRTVLKLVMTAVAMLCIASVCAGQEASPLPSPTGFVNDYAGVIDEPPADPGPASLGTAVEILPGAELQRVDKNADHDALCQRAGVAHQSDVTRMQIAHGGHKRAIGVRGFPQCKFGGGVQDVHGV